MSIKGVRRLLLQNDVPCLSRCSKLKNPHCSMAVCADHRSKFAALYRWWWRLQMSERFLSGTKNSKQTKHTNKLVILAFLKWKRSWNMFAIILYYVDLSTYLLMIPLFFCLLYLSTHCDSLQCLTTVWCMMNFRPIHVWKYMLEKKHFSKVKTCIFNKCLLWLEKFLTVS